MSFDFDLTAPFQTAFTTRDQHEHRHKVRPVQQSKVTRHHTSFRCRVGKELNCTVKYYTRNCELSKQLSLKTYIIAL
ncbi:hypothetical protein CRE_16949 [Caenorhabditis remanei]|uniref:Uncharacterized protein n=1 Tax=Caenorhabditis remanei TaxID=31234 RepID=E3N2A0_CAERE|nr:hypothetical protein CRE_16949 [Caenorhabditis remanei]